MRTQKFYIVVCVMCIAGASLMGCGNTQSSEQSAMAKTQPALKDNPTVSAEVKAQVEAAKQGEVQKMNQYAQEMSAKYKSNPPVAK